MDPMLLSLGIKVLEFEFEFLCLFPPCLHSMLLWFDLVLLDLLTCSPSLPVDRTAVFIYSGLGLSVNFGLPAGHVDCLELSVKDPPPGHGWLSSFTFA